MCIRCLKEGMNIDSTSGGEYVNLRPRWCPTGVDESWWVQEVHVDSMSIQTVGNTSCQLRYCYSSPVVLCTPCQAQSAMPPLPRSLSSRRSKSVVESASGSLSTSAQTPPHIPGVEPPCWLVIPDMNQSFLHHSSLLRALADNGLTFWSFDSRSQGLSECPESAQCLSVDSLESYATDLRAVLLRMRDVLPPSTCIGVVAMGVMGNVLLAKKHMWSDCIQGGTLVLSSALDMQWCLQLSRLAPWTRSRRSVHVSPTVAAVLLSVHRAALVGLHAALSTVVPRLAPLVLHVARVVQRLVKRKCWPSRVLKGMTSLLQLAKGATARVDTLAQWLHDTPSWVVPEGQDTEIPAMNSALHSRYPFLRPRPCSVAWCSLLLVMPPPCLSIASLPTHGSVEGARGKVTIVEGDATFNRLLSVLE